LRPQNAGPENDETGAFSVNAVEVMVFKLPCQYDAHSEPSVEVKVRKRYGYVLAVSKVVHVSHYSVQ